MARRSYGTGSLYVRADSAGRESWYGQWRTSGRRVKRCVGLVRIPGSRDGLTRTQAEAKLRQLMAETPVARPANERLTLAEVAPRYVDNLKAKGRKPSTIRRRLASISVAHQVAGFETPTADAGVRAVWPGIRRTQGMAPRKMRAARTKVITAMVAPLGDGLADARDRALLPSPRSRPRSRPARRPRGRRSRCRRGPPLCARASRGRAGDRKQRTGG